MHFIPTIMQRCKDEGIKITREGLYFTGQKNGFLIKNEDGKFQLDENRFEDWIKERKTDVPEGYKKIVELASIFNLSKGTCYLILKKNPDICLKKKGITYVKEEEFGRIVRKH